MLGFPSQARPSSNKRWWTLGLRHWKQRKNSIGYCTTYSAGKPASGSIKNVYYLKNLSNTQPSNKLFFQEFSFKKPQIILSCHVSIQNGKEYSGTPTLWCQLEDSVLLIGTLLLFDPVLFPKYEAWLLIGSILNFEALLGAPLIKTTQYLLHIPLKVCLLIGLWVFQCLEAWLFIGTCFPIVTRVHNMICKIILPPATCYLLSVFWVLPLLNP